MALTVPVPLKGPGGLGATAGSEILETFMKIGCPKRY